MDKRSLATAMAAASAAEATALAHSPKGHPALKEPDAGIAALSFLKGPLLLVQAQRPPVMLPAACEKESAEAAAGLAFTIPLLLLLFGQGAITIGCSAGGVGLKGIKHLRLCSGLLKPVMALWAHACIWLCQCGLYQEHKLVLLIFCSCMWMMVQRQRQRQRHVGQACKVPLYPGFVVGVEREHVRC